MLTESPNRTGMVSVETCADIRACEAARTW
jgi:hypothetical protein